jgi:hypothetical protein
MKEAKKKIKKIGKKEMKKVKGGKFDGGDGMPEVIRAKSRK